MPTVRGVARESVPGWKVKEIQVGTIRLDLSTVLEILMILMSSSSLEVLMILLRIRENS